MGRLQPETDLQHCSQSFGAAESPLEHRRLEVTAWVELHHKEIKAPVPPIWLEDPRDGGMLDLMHSPYAGEEAFLARSVEEPANEDLDRDNLHPFDVPGAPDAPKSPLA